MKFNDCAEAFSYLIDKELESGSNQMETAEKIGVSPQAITNALRRRSMKFNALKKSAEAIGFSVHVTVTKSKPKN